ncbi:MAG: MATE family efflux transporter, partial [Desulfobacterales bacterium]
LIGLLFSKQIFVLAGHPEEVQKMERLYFSILCYGSIFHIAMSTLSTFFTGRGITRPVMIITLVGVVINIPLDFVLIFGKCGFPELGIAGAALATVTAWVINTVLLAILVFTRKNNQEFQLLTNYKFDKDLFSRLMRYGVPGAMQFTIDILAFTFFILMVGRIGKAELAATNIALSINSLAFMPSMGASQGISVLVGQALGKRKPKHASLYIRSCTHLLLGYIFVVDCLFILFPDVILGLFLHSNSTDSASITVFYYSKTLLNIVCAYLFFDSLYMIYSGALRGAGDTKFMMLAMGSAGICCLIIPTYLSIEYFKMGVTSAWLWIVFFIFILFLLSGLRLRGGKWKKMLVIEDN